MQTAEQKKAWEEAHPRRGRSYADMGIQVDTQWKRTQGSLAASKDPEVQKKINRGRRQAAADLRAANNWASSGFNSAGGFDE